MQEGTYKVKITLEDEFIVEQEKEQTAVKVYMLKGEKGDPGTGGGGAWGEITGTLSDQTDLQTALNAKVNSTDLAEVATSGDHDDLSNKPNVTYTSASVDTSTRMVTQVTTTETVSGTKPMGSYGAYNYIPLDMSSYTAGTAAKALAPETHLPDGRYMVTARGYIRHGATSAILEPGTIIIWDSNELSLLGYNACEYWAYDSGEGTWSGGYFTTQDDVEDIIADAGTWTKVTTAFTVANKDNGYYKFEYSSASGTSRRIVINVEGTNTYYFPYNGTIAIKSDTYFVLLGRQNLIFEYDSTNSYYKQPIDLSQLSAYTLPTASASTLGGVKVGTNLSIDANGALSATDTTYTAGTGISISNNEITATNNGTITGVSANGTSVATSGVANIPAATTSAYGVTQLSDSTSSTSTALAATANAVKTAYDLANGKASITLSTTDIGEGSQLAANTLYGVYE